MAVRYIKRIGIIKMGSSTMKEYTKHLEFWRQFKAKNPNATKEQFLKQKDIIKQKA